LRKKQKTENGRQKKEGISNIEQGILNDEGEHYGGQENRKSGDKRIRGSAKSTEDGGQRGKGTK